VSRREKLYISDSRGGFMTFASHILWNYLWVAPHLLQVVLVWLIVRRGLHRQFKWFFSYTVFEIFENAILFPLFHLPAIIPAQIYTRVWFAFLAVSALLRCAVTYEIVRYLSREYSWLKSVGRAVLRWLIVILLFSAIIFAISTHPTHMDNSITFIFYLSDRSVFFFQSGLLIGLLAFSRILHLRWRAPVFGITLGLGIYASIELITSTISSQFGYVYSLDFVTMGTYHVCVLIWLFYFLRREPPSGYTLQDLPERSELDVWNRELERVVQR
jgi:hypothetical protein